MTSAQDSPFTIFKPRTSTFVALYFGIILLSNLGVVYWVFYFLRDVTLLDAFRFFFVAPFCLILAEHSCQWGIYLCLWGLLLLPAFLMRSEVGRLFGCFWILLLIPLNICTACLVINGNRLDQGLGSRSPYSQEIANRHKSPYSEP